MESVATISDEDLQSLEDSVILDATGWQARLAAALASLPPEVRHQPRHLLSIDKEITKEIAFAARTARPLSRRRPRGQPVRLQRRPAPTAQGTGPASPLERPSVILRQ